MKMKRKRDTLIGMAFLIVLGVSCLYVLCGPEEKHAVNTDENWMWNDYDLALEKAQAENRAILIDFWAVWCKECKEMDKHAFQDPHVRSLLDEFILLKVDVDDVPQLKSQFLVVGMPTVVVVSPDGTEITRAVGYQTADQMYKVLKEALERVR
jgi:thiol:disulfide interchange protein